MPWALLRRAAGSDKLFQAHLLGGLVAKAESTIKGLDKLLRGQAEQIPIHSSEL